MPTAPLGDGTPRDRGYAVAKENLTMTRQQFVEKFGADPPRDDLNISARHPDDESDKCQVFFLEDKREKVGVGPIRLCVF